MLPSYPASVFPVTSSLGTEAGRVGDKLHWKSRGVQDFFAIVIRDWNLGCGNKIEAALVFQFEKIGFEFWQLPGPEQGVAVDNERRQSLLIPMFARVQVKHEIDQRSFETR